MTEQPTEASFLKDVERHELTIIRDDGVSRHIRFKSPDSYNMHFDLITWPGYLCYVGDMGTYVFRRLEDMFGFFRTDKNDFNYNKNGLSINPGYWGEKLEAYSALSQGHKEYSQEKFIKTVTEQVNAHIEENGITGTEAEDLREAIQDQVLSEAEFEATAYIAARDFDQHGFNMYDFEYSCDEYTYHYLWCCYALAWGVAKYDQSKQMETEDGIKS